MHYDALYRQPALFGEPYPELIRFFREDPSRGTLLDVGCGQGRNAIALARMGYVVTGIDLSAVGVAQMTEVARREGLSITGLVTDLYAFDGYGSFDVLLLDSLFHFARRDRAREAAFLQRLLRESRAGCRIVCCLQDTGHKVDTLERVMADAGRPFARLADLAFRYTFEHVSTGHRSETPYRLIAVRT